ncbi:DUF6757 family protein [Candidatus Halobonum tyrrellensis]|uniref:Uncharacterized protein n=1 Tax=Candidatus Halobonum tyrrellensis G22 TaxID=1324957 RepID=V4GWH6_9EURY|nr:DUF6757 family protein [Candidatus Halobonum tyrrellensis]ESP89511.1 hypothetical protein K933_03105 [Candidatus Halobonum tyrrellensis G22]
MRCHYCEREAAYTADRDGVRVGLCENHFRERVEELAESEGLEALRERVDVTHADDE